MIAAGMGGGLVIHILEEGKKVVETLEACVLQPQSEIDKVRRYVTSHGLRIEEEDLVVEDGKYYPMMRVVHGEDEAYEEWEYIYGKCLLKKKHPLLLEYLNRELQIKGNILKSLEGRDGERLRARVQEIENEMELARKALESYR